MTLRVALITGPMYDGLNTWLRAAAGVDIDVVAHGDHPTLNRRVAALLDAGERIDVLSTHGKYAPSQRHWLHPLDDLIAVDTIAALAPGAVDLCRFDGRLLCVPRNIDVRVLWSRRDLVDPLPDTWDDVVRARPAFGFPGRESGLFGTFFELIVAFGGRLFDEGGQPVIISDEAIAAVELLCRLAKKAPAELPDWHYDEADAALVDGRVAMAGAWPGGTNVIRRSRFADHLVPSLYPRGPARRVSYAGCHGWAIPKTCADLDGAAQLVTLLCSADAATVDARAGTVCAHTEAFASVTPVDEIDARRLEVTALMIADAMITYPPLERFPEIEDAGWSALHSALRGEIDAAAAVHRVQAAATAAIRSPL